MSALTKVTVPQKECLHNSLIIAMFVDKFNGRCNNTPNYA